MLYDKLNTLDRLPMHMPGHKRNAALAPYLRALGAGLDITEIDGFDNLHQPEGILADCMAQAADLWGSRSAHLLINGSSGGILAAIRTMTRRGDKILLTRGAHKSVFHAIELCGLVPVFVTPPVLAPYDILAPLSPADIENALSAHPDTRLVIVTSPTYEGVISDIPAICAVAHSRGVAVMVDEAHGAHLGLGGGFADGAVKGGADIVVQSLHKTLPSLTQTAMLHVCSDRVDTERLAHQLAVFQTSSPSYLLLASIDGCVQLLREKPALLTDWSATLSHFDGQIAPLKKLQVLGHNTPLPCPFDLSKLPIFTGCAGTSGYDLARLLREEFAIEPEYAAPGMVLCMTGAGDTDATLSRLAEALLEIDSRCAYCPPPAVQPVTALLQTCEMVMPPEEALGRESRLIPLEEAAGQICGEYIWAYPPGIPLLIPGERIPRELYDAVRSGTAPELHSTSGKFAAYIRALS